MGHKSLKDSQGHDATAYSGRTTARVEASETPLVDATERVQNDVSKTWVDSRAIERAPVKCGSVASR
jgi:hypothetical protein